MRQPELCAQLALAALHLARVGFMVVACEVQESVKNQDSQLNRESVTLLGCLATRRVDADGHIACDFFPVLDWICGGERENVGCRIFAAETFVQIADRCVGRKQHRDLAAEFGSVLGLRKVSA
jgi:hypothetical protein